jgi:hypothetical protein
MSDVAMTEGLNLHYEEDDGRHAARYETLNIDGRS